MAKKKIVKSEETMLGNTRIFMERTMGGAASKAGSDAEFQAQDLYYDAMETGDMDLIFKALELDPANTDCLLQVLAAFDDTDPEGILFAQQIVKVAADRLGPELFEECKGVFWGLLETRPYMRARSELAQRLVKMRMLDEAIVEHEGMLELCPNDNLGIRYGLIGLYLQKDRIKDAARLLIKFADERQYSAVMAWAYVLERFLNGKLDAATKALAVARKQNGHVEAYLKGHRKLPKNPAGSYSPGSREEAQMCAELQKPAWDAHPEAVKWLGNVMPKA
jgi:tetratricopeptide (TPR) repeat protein